MQWGEGVFEIAQVHAEGGVHKHGWPLSSCKNVCTPQAKNVLHSPEKMSHFFVKIFYDRF